MPSSKPHLSSKGCELVLPAMGGQFTYKAFAQPNRTHAQVKELFISAHREVSRIENKYTEFKDSEIERINGFAGIKPYRVDTETYNLILESKRYYQLSQGAFDITYSARNKLWRESKGRKISLVDKLKLKALVDFKKVKLNKNNMTVYLPYKGMRIGFGGIGKGYAVDRAFEQLKKEGLINFSVNGSGDIRVHSQSEAPRKWKIGIRNPFNQDPTITAGIVQIENGSVSTSGSYIQNFEKINSQKVTINNHHIYSKNGKSKEAIPVSCTVVTDNCIDSDVWATVAMALDAKSALELLDRNDLYGIIIDCDGKSLLTKRAVNNFNR